MAKIRHIAISTPDPEKTAAFYQQVFGLELVARTDSPLAKGVFLSDGHINLALLRFKTAEAVARPEGVEYQGLHHFGFHVEDMEEVLKRLEEQGAPRLFDRPEHEKQEGEGGLYFEIKARDPNGIMFDVSSKGWAVSKPGT
ncbi:MAG: VOC family protein [Deltaproteobacteria bacterium]|nr:VOC family protein [Deltaproteobacteria bacterium]MBI3079027.1 VOC family protein [Deltaproteobacteria bacterium]